MASRSSSTTQSTQNTTNVSNVTDARSITNISSDPEVVKAALDASTTLGIESLRSNADVVEMAFDFGGEALERVDDSSRRATETIGAFSASALGTLSDSFGKSLQTVESAFTKAGDQVGVNTGKIAEAFSKTTPEGQVIDFLKVFAAGSFTVGTIYILIKRFGK